MSQPILYFAITSHGFGHVVRSVSVVAKIKEIYPDLTVILTTTAPRWLLDSYLKTDFIHRPRSFDVGVIQGDSLTMDKKATLNQLQSIWKKQNSIIASEVNYLKTNQVNLILGDIPFLLPLMAKKANIPCWMISNFGWDFIYRDWGESFKEITDWIYHCYQESDLLFRLPMSESMGAFPNIIDVGLTGGDPFYSQTDLREKFKIKTPKEDTILLTFGGLGLNTIPYHNLSKFSHYQFITFDPQAPELPNLLKISDRNYRPVDFMPLCSKVISKPGYSTFAEALKLDLPIISLKRDNFAEASLLLNTIQDRSQHLIISPEEFEEGNWDFITQDLNPPRTNLLLPKNGNETIAQSVVKYFKN
jgi:hypothetical protein